MNYLPWLAPVAYCCKDLHCFFSCAVIIALSHGDLRLAAVGCSGRVQKLCVTSFFARRSVPASGHQFSLSGNFSYPLSVAGADADGAGVAAAAC